MFRKSLTEAQISVSNSHAYCKLCDGSVKDLAQDTVYTHPTEKQCNYSAADDVDQVLQDTGLPIHDIRTYPVREGYSISAGDVVNVGREVLGGTEVTYGDLSVGTTIQINENGSPVEYIVVHQGNPDPSLYDESCSGTWLMRKEIAEQRAWDDSSYNYSASSIHEYLNGDWMNRYDSELSTKIKQAKLPYCDATSSNTVHSLSNGLSCKAFLFSLVELGINPGQYRWLPEDGAKLTYFILGESTDANSKRMADFDNGYETISIEYSSRTGINDSGVRSVCTIGERGDYSIKSLPCNCGIRVGIIMDSSELTGDEATYGPESVYKAQTSEANVEHITKYNGNSTVPDVIGTDIVKINDQYSVFAYISDNYEFGTEAILIDNVTVEQANTDHFDIAGTTDSVSLARLDDSRFIAGYIDTFLAFRLYTINSNTIVSVGSISDDWNSNPTDLNVIALSETKFFHCSCMADKLYYGIVTISGNNMTLAKRGQYLSTINPTFLSACRLSDDASGNARICACFSDIDDGNRGEAVVITIDSSNNVTFGSVVTFETTAIAGTGKGVVCCKYGDSVVVLYTIANGARAKVLNISGTAITSNSYTTVKSITVNQLAIASDETSIAAFYNDGSGKCVTLTKNGNNLTVGEEFAFNSGTTRYISAIYTDNGEIIAAYSDNNQDRTTVITGLEASGNLIGGSITNLAKDAIALESGNSGDNIRIGFGGYCECPGVTKDQSIISSGVSAYAIQDNWLDISSRYGKGYIVGEYTGDGSSTRTISVGFTPTYVIIGGFNYRATISIKYQNRSLVRGFGNYNVANTTHGITENGFIVGTRDCPELGSTPDANTNVSGALYSYIAWR